MWALRRKKSGVGWLDVSKLIEMVLKINIFPEIVESTSSFALREVCI